jgi:magnesium chelatase family protein
MLSRVYACAITGLDGHIIEVEVDFNPRAGIPSFTIVGLPDAAVKESRERVRAAIKNSNRSTYQRKHQSNSLTLGEAAKSFEDQSLYKNEQQQFGLQFPNKGYVVNLSPADMPKHGPSYDLAIAIGVLAATDQVPLTALENALFVGELSLDGSVRHIKGVMPMAFAAREAGFETIYIPAEDASEAALVTGIDIVPVESLGQLVEHLYGLNPIPPYRIENSFAEDAVVLPDGITDFSAIRGQEHVKRALEIAAGGNHNVRLVGPPGTGKTLLARAIPGILPRLTLEEALEVTRIYSVADMLRTGHPLMQNRPFRAPHHTISQAGMVGGGTIPRPGEVTLAHRGVLFLDEATEYGTHTLEVLRQPIEDKIVTISRAKGSLTFPANFLLVLAQNPCACGYFGDPIKPCTCTPTMITRYQSRLSGPLLDRIDIHVEVPRVDYDKLMRLSPSESSSAIRERVEKARERQQARFARHPGLFANSDMGASEIQQFCQMSNEARSLLELSVKRMQLSARAYHRILKLSRTIADLGDSERIEVQHAAEAVQYRPQQQVM